MAWNIAKPADADLISDSAADLRANFQAIEEGSGDFFQDKVVLKEQGSDPSVIADRSLVYGKEVGSQTELHSRNDASGDSVVQLTDSGRMGSATTPTTVQNIRFGTETVDYDDSFVPRAWGLVASGGASFTINKNFIGVSSGGTGQYTVDITGLGDGGANFADGDAYAVLATAGTSINRFVSVTTKTATSFVLRIKDDTGTNRDAECSVFLYKA